MIVLITIINTTQISKKTKCADMNDDDEISFKEDAESSEGEDDTSTREGHTEIIIRRSFKEGIRSNAAKSAKSLSKKPN